MSHSNSHCGTYAASCCLRYRCSNQICFAESSRNCVVRSTMRDTTEADSCPKSAESNLTASPLQPGSQLHLYHSARTGNISLVLSMLDTSSSQSNLMTREEIAAIAFWKCVGNNGSEAIPINCPISGAVMFCCIPPRLMQSVLLHTFQSSKSRRHVCALIQRGIRLLPRLWLLQPHRLGPSACPHFDRCLRRLLDSRLASGYQQ